MTDQDYSYMQTCPTCDTEFPVKEDVNGECPNCHRKYEWDFDGDYGQDSVYMPCFEEIKQTGLKKCDGCGKEVHICSAIDVWIVVEGKLYCLTCQGKIKNTTEP